MKNIVQEDSSNMKRHTRRSYRTLSNILARRSRQTIQFLMNTLEDLIRRSERHKLNEPKAREI